MTNEERLLGRIADHADSALDAFTDVQAMQTVQARQIRVLQQSMLTAGVAVLLLVVLSAVLVLEVLDAKSAIRAQQLCVILGHQVQSPPIVKIRGELHCTDTPAPQPASVVVVPSPVPSPVFVPVPAAPVVPSQPRTVPSSRPVVPVSPRTTQAPAPAPTGAPVPAPTPSRPTPAPSPSGLRVCVPVVGCVL